MLTRNARRLAFVAAILGLVLLIRVWIDHRPRDDNVPRSSPTDARHHLVAPAPGRVGPDEPTAAASDATGSSGVPHRVTGATVDGTRVRLDVHTPSDVRVGEVFEVRIEIDANAALHDLMFSIAYPKSRLALAGWSRGNFAQLRDLPADLGAEEPSDGNIQVTYTVSNELSATGAGTFAVFQFEAIKPGVSAITLQNVSASDVVGNIDPHAFVLHDGQVTVY